MRKRYALTRMSTLVLFCLLISGPVLFAQQSAPKPTKVRTPEQQALQQQIRQWREEWEHLRAQIKQAFDAEMARDKPDCPDARTTYDENVCLGIEFKTTTGHYRAYTEALRALLALKYPSPEGDHADASGPTGKPLTPEENLKEFDQVQTAWDTYQKTMCSAAYDNWKGGTVAPSMESECELQTIRSHMRELDRIYEPNATR